MYVFFLFNLTLHYLSVQQFALLKYNFKYKCTILTTFYKFEDLIYIYFWRKFTYPYWSCIYLIKKTVKTVVSWNINKIFNCFLI